MKEVDVTLTDFAVALEAAIFLVLLAARPGPASALRRWFIAFFGSVGAASLFGGIVHGFFPNGTTSGSAILWRATLIAMGVTAISMWAIGAEQ